MLISRADVAGVFLTFVRFGTAPGSRGVGAVLIDRDTPGLEIGPGEETLGGELLFPVYYRDVRVPNEAVLVKEQGFRKLMTAFNGQRCLNAAISLGQAQGAFDEALSYVDQRKQFGQRLADFQGIQWLLADMAIELDAARLLIYRAASNAGAGLPDPIEAAKAKAFANEVAIRVSNQAHAIVRWARLFEVDAGRALRARCALWSAGRWDAADPAQHHRRISDWPSPPAGRLRLSYMPLVCNAGRR